ncbi:LytTR family DNA-binding domain-containing protein [Chryseobacterium fluminis]|uniref:LytR/AlgR family response regulator transcription factor n=1 Tax=Chryseobacterium fluminis TaxID=2983606 RepID=UPI0022511749|nr:LytTR family DNA-binding domain-containing protein [Chryseobacterium sp. MMS21-Ot14]UZT99059.1 LytTR family DNA-binding domain-containing protein [Chryseobacterium sp. MMS21-Ot14]
MKIVIIEDELLIANDLSQTLREIHPEIEIQALLPSVELAVQFFQTFPTVDLIFSDIELEDGFSFEIFKSVKINTPVIFCTAYDAYALEAFKANGVEYILKPFSKTLLEKSLKKFESLRHSLNESLSRQYKATTEALEAYQKKTVSTLMVRYRNQLIPISFSKIFLIYIENDLTYIYTTQHQKYVVPNTLDEMESKAGESFFRVNRQFLVNRNSVRETHHALYRKLSIVFTFDFNREVLVSKEKTSKFISWLSQ